MFVDSHAHLDGSQFDSDREKVIACAREAGVRTMVAIGNGDGPPHLILRSSHGARSAWITITIILRERPRSRCLRGKWNWRRR